MNAFQTQPIEVQHAALLELLDKELRNKATDTLAGYEPDMPVEAAAEKGDARGLLDIVRGIFEASNPIFMRRHTYFNTRQKDGEDTSSYLASMDKFALAANLLSLIHI